MRWAAIATFRHPSAISSAAAAENVSYACEPARFELLDSVNNMFDNVTNPACHGSDIHDRFRIARRRGPPLQSPLHAAHRRARGRFSRKSLLTDPGARALRA